MGLYIKFDRLLVIDASIDLILFPGPIGRKMLYPLNTKNMGGQAMGIPYPFAPQKHVQEFPIIILPADSPILQLHDEGRILYDASDDVIRNF